MNEWMNEWMKECPEIHLTLSDTGRVSYTHTHTHGAVWGAQTQTHVETLTDTQWTLTTLRQTVWSRDGITTIITIIIIVSSVSRRALCDRRVNWGWCQSSLTTTTTVNWDLLDAVSTTHIQTYRQTYTTDTVSKHTRHRPILLFVDRWITVITR